MSGRCCQHNSRSLPTGRDHDFHSTFIFSFQNLIKTLFWRGVHILVVVVCLFDTPHEGSVGWTQRLLRAHHCAHYLRVSEVDDAGQTYRDWIARWPSKLVFFTVQDFCVALCCKQGKATILPSRPLAPTNENFGPCPQKPRFSCLLPVCPVPFWSFPYEVVESTS